MPARAAEIRGVIRLRFNHKGAQSKPEIRVRATAGNSRFLVAFAPRNDNLFSRCRDRPAVKPARHHALAFFNRDGLSGVEIRELIYLAAGPLNLDAVRFRLRAQAEGEY